MPKPPSQEELFCAALYMLTGAELKGLMVDTMARNLGITFEAAQKLAADCAERGWLEHESHTVTLRAPGFDVAGKVLEEASRTETRPSGHRPRRT